MKLWEYIQFDPSFCIGYVSTSGRDLETGSCTGRFYRKFVQENTLIWGRSRSKRSNRVILGCKGLKMMTIHQIFRISLEILMTSLSLRSTLRREYCQLSEYLLYFERNDDVIVSSERKYRNYDQTHTFRYFPRFLIRKSLPDTIRKTVQ